MEDALTYAKQQTAKLKASQLQQPTPPLSFPRNQAINSNTQATLLPATLFETTSKEESKKIVVILDPLNFNDKEKDISYDYWLLQMRNKIVTNEKMMLTELLKKLYVQSRVSGDALT